MFYLGLLLPLVYIPGVTGVEVLTQWALLSLALPIILYGRLLPPKVFLIWFAFGVLSIATSLHWITWLWGMVVLSIWGLSFQLGRSINNPVPLYRGLALGLAVSSILCIAQWLDWITIASSGGYAGLLFNNGILSISCGLIIIALAMYQQTELIPFLVPALLLAHSRAGWFAIAIGTAARVHWLLPLAILAACGFLVNSTTDPLRLQVWGITLQCLSWLPHGSGSFMDLFYQDATGQLIHPEYAHNDYLQLWYEYGAFALLPYLGIASGLLWRASPLVYASAAVALVEPVLENPIPAFILCFALGHTLRDFELRELVLRLSRSGLLPRRLLHSPVDREALPIHLDPT